MKDRDNKPQRELYIDLVFEEPINRIKTATTNLGRLQDFLQGDEYPLLIQGGELPKPYVHEFVEKARQANLFLSSSLVEYALSVESGQGMLLQTIRDGLLYHARVDAVTLTIEAAENIRALRHLNFSAQKILEDKPELLLMDDPSKITTITYIGNDGQEVSKIIDINLIQIDVLREDIKDFTSNLQRNWKLLFDNEPVAVDALDDYLSLTGGDPSRFQDAIMGMPGLTAYGLKKKK